MEAAQGLGGSTTSAAWRSLRTATSSSLRWVTVASKSSPRMGRPFIRSANRVTAPASSLHLAVSRSTTTAASSSLTLLAHVSRNSAKTGRSSACGVPRFRLRLNLPTSTTSRTTAGLTLNCSPRSRALTSVQTRSLLSGLAQNPHDVGSRTGDPYKPMRLIKWFRRLQLQIPSHSRPCQCSRTLTKWSSLRRLRNPFEAGSNQAWMRF